MKEKFLKHKTVIISCSVFALTFFLLVCALFAVISDRKTAVSKKIKADGIDIDFCVLGLDGTAPDEYTSVRTNDNPLFNYDKWSPGFTAVRTIKVASSHGEQVKYNVKVSVLPIKEQKSMLNLSELSKQIEVYRLLCDTQEELPSVSDSDISSLEYIGTLSQVLEKGATVFYDTLSLETDTEDFAIVALRMSDDANGNFESIAVSNYFDLTLYAFELNE